MKTRAILMTVTVSAMLAASAAAVSAAPCGDRVGPFGLDLPCRCGDTVVADTVLKNTDPIVKVDPMVGCVVGGEASDGLIVAPGVHLDLGGKTIRGHDRSASGLILQGKGGSVSNGRVQSFLTGIASDGPIAGWEISNVTASFNIFGISLMADETSIAGSSTVHNEAGAVAVSGSRNVLVRIACSRNGDGIVVAGAGNVLERNLCERNAGTGIRVIGDDNVLVRNYGANNGGEGVIAAGNRNDFQSNQGSGNDQAGVLGFGADPRSNGRNDGGGNGGANCRIDGFPTIGGRYC